MNIRFAALVALALVVSPAAALAQAIEYRLLATAKTSTMEKEMREAAAAGYRYRDVTGGNTALGGAEVVVVMQKDGTPGTYDYRLLAATRTSTMQKELQEAADAGFEFRGQTVFKTRFGGDEVVCILEKRLRTAVARYEYLLLASKKTSTMQKDLIGAGAAGFEFVGLTVARSGIAGEEVVAILRRPVM
jgi:hypothetical protein